jgi:hypothetical protein
MVFRVGKGFIAGVVDAHEVASCLTENMLKKYTKRR